jgi:transposase-like protein
MDNSTTQNKTAASKEAFLTQLEQSFGLVATTCRKAGISRSTYYKWRKEDTDFANKADEVRELQKDAVEALILKKMKCGDTAMLIFYAKTQMKDRGYVERTEVVGKDGADLSFTKYDLSKLTEAQRQALLSIGNDILNGTSHDTEKTSDTFNT